MTFWAKLLTVIVLVLSVFFAAASALLFAGKTEWRQSYEVLKLNTDARIADLDGKLKAMTNDYKKADADRTQLAADKLGLEATNKALTAQIQTLEGTVSEKTRMIDTQNAQIVYFQEENKKAEDRYTAMRDLKEKVENEGNDLRTKLADSEKANRQLTERNAALTDDLQKTRENLTAVTEMLAAKSELIAHLYDVFPNMRPQIDTFAKLEKRVNGKVVAVDEASGIVIINVGTKAGVEKDYKFTVYRNGEFKGMIRIFALNGDSLAAGRIEYLAKDAQADPKKIEMGDDVATAIGY